MAAIYPQTPVPSTPFEVEQRWRTLISQTDTGKEYRRRKWIRPRRRIKLRYRNYPKSELDLIWQFYTERKGAYESFMFIFPYAENWTNEYVGKGSDYFATGADNTIAYYLPVKEPTSITLSIDGKTFYPLYSYKWTDIMDVNQTWSNAIDTNKTWANYISWDGQAHGYYFVYFSQSLDKDYAVLLNYDVPATSIIYANFEGKPVLDVRFEEDNLSKSVFVNLLTTLGINLVEVR